MPSLAAGTSEAGSSPNPVALPNTSRSEEAPNSGTYR